MTSSRISKHLLQAIQEKTDEIEPFRDFLVELIYEESRRAGSWWFKEYYKKKIEEYSQKWVRENEDYASLTE